MREVDYDEFDQERNESDSLTIKNSDDKNEISNDPGYNGADDDLLNRTFYLDEGENLNISGSNEDLISDNNNLFEVDDVVDNKKRIKNQVKDSKKKKKSNDKQVSAASKKSANKKASNEINDGLIEADKAMREVEGWNFTPNIPRRSKPSLWRRFWTSFSHGAALVAKAVTNVVTAPIVLIKYNRALNKLSKAVDVMQKKKNIDLIPGWDGAEFEKKKDEFGEEDGWDMINDPRRVPVVWSYPTAEAAEVEKGVIAPPEVSVYSDQAKAGSSRTFDGLNMGHSMIGIHYSRKSKSSNRVERYIIKYGFYPAGGTTIPSMAALMTNQNAFFPGQLSDDISHAYTISKRYKATEEQVGKILKASETYASGGYNYHKRNCTTFVRDMIIREAGLDTGGKIFEEEPIRYNFLNNALSFVGGVMGSYASAGAISGLADLSRKQDLSYQNYGNNRATAQDVKNYLDSRERGSGSKSGLTPGVAGENMRRIGIGTSGGDFSAYNYFGTMGSNSDNAKISFDDLADNIKTSYQKMADQMQAIIPNGQAKPPELELFLTSSGYLNPYMSMINAATELNNYYADNNKQEKEDEKSEAAREEKKNDKNYNVPKGIFSEADLKNMRKDLDDCKILVNKIYQFYFKGDLRINKAVMEYLSILEAGSTYIDRIYRDTASGRKIDQNVYENTNDQMYLRNVRI